VPDLSLDDEADVEPPRDVGPDNNDNDVASSSCNESQDCGVAAPCEGAWECNLGQCRRQAPVVCAGDGSCVLGVCAPRVSRADANGCITEPATAETPCDDADLCTSGEICGSETDAGRCVAGDRVVCDEASDCRSEGVCDPATGSCDSTSTPDGDLCMDAI